jgi:glycopeptide antibiotics resistance protein
MSTVKRLSPKHLLQVLFIQKQMKSFLNGLRFALKYGAYLTVIIDIIGYSIEKFENVENKPTKIDKND